MNPSRGHAGFNVDDALAGAYFGAERDPEDVKFMVQRTLSGVTTLTAADGQVAVWHQRRSGDKWLDEGDIAFGAMKTAAFEACAQRVRKANG